MKQRLLFVTPLLLLFFTCIPAHVHADFGAVSWEVQSSGGTNPSGYPFTWLTGAITYTISGFTSSPFYNYVMPEGAGGGSSTIFGTARYPADINASSVVPLGGNTSVSVSWLTGQPTGYYWSCFYNTNSPTLLDDCGGADAGFLFYWDGSAVSPPPPVPGSTQIYTVDPANASTTSTTTPTLFGASGYVSDSDYVSGMIVRIKYFNNVKAASLAVGPLFSDTGNAICSALPDWLCPPAEGEDANYLATGPQSGTIEFPITSSGAFDFSTTTQLDYLGTYNMTTRIIRPSSLPFPFTPLGETSFVSTSTRFTVATTSSYDRSTGSVVQSILDQQKAVNPQCSFDFTISGDFLPSIRTCLLSVFAVPFQEVVDLMQANTQTLLARAPWGYGVRAYTILTSQNIATTTPPSFALTFPIGPMSGRTFDFTPWDYMAGPGSFLATAETPDGTPILPLLLFWWDVLCYSLYAISIISLIFNIKNEFVFGDEEDWIYEDEDDP